MELCPVACGINCGINFKKETPEALKIKGSGRIVIIPTLRSHRDLFPWNK
jgi:hypothetical protein